jgi:hypothetical protein
MCLGYGAHHSKSKKEKDDAAAKLKADAAAAKVKAKAAAPPVVSVFSGAVGSRALPQQITDVRGDATGGCCVQVEQAIEEETTADQQQLVAAATEAAAVAAVAAVVVGGPPSTDTSGWSVVSLPGSDGDLSPNAPPPHL